MFQLGPTTMFRTVPMKTRLLFSGIVGIVAVIFLSGMSIYSLWQSELELERQIDMMHAVRYELTTDMMHDAIEANVVSAMMLGPAASDKKKEALYQQMEVDIQDLRQALADLMAMSISGELDQAIVEIEPKFESFIDQANVVVDLAFTKSGSAFIQYQKFLKQIEQLETDLLPLGKSIERLSENSAIAAKAHDQRLLVTNLGFSIAMIILMSFNARSLTRTITVPIARLRAALREVAEGDFDQKIADIMREDDFGEIAKDIDAVSGRVVIALQEQEALRKEGDSVIERLRHGLQRMSEGDLSVRINTQFNEAYDPLRINYNETVDRLNDLLAEVVTAAAQIRGQSDQISDASQDLSTRTESQAATLEETAAALEEMTRSVNTSAQNAKEIEGAVATAKSDVARSGEVVEGAVSAMNAIESSSGRISQIIGVIDDIAFQTNLLALNAGVEAARAGEVGRGFAVVASEVRVLAQRSSQAANEIKTLIGDSTRHVQEGVEKVQNAGHALTDVIDHVNEISKLMSNISSEATEQAQGLNEVNVGVAQLDQVTQQNVSMVEESSQSIRQMNDQTKGLDALVGQFKLRGSGSSGSPAVAQNAADVWQLDEVKDATFAQSA